MTATLSSWSIEMQFETDVWSDVTSDVIISDLVRADSGIMSNKPTDRIARTGRLQFSLNNSADNSAGLAGYYSPGHNNVRSGFATGIPVRCRVSYDGYTRTKFYGRIAKDGIKPDTGIYGSRRTKITVLDWMNQAATHELILPEYTTNKRIDEIVPLIISNMPLAPLATSYDTGVETFVSVFDTVRSKTTAMSELKKLALSEWSFIYITHDKDNDEILKVENQNSRDCCSVTTIPDASMDAGFLLKEDGDYLLQDDWDNAIVPVQLTSNYANADSKTFRMHYPYWSISNTGMSKMKVEFTAGTSYFYISRAYIGHKGAGDFDFDGTPTQIDLTQFGTFALDPGTSKKSLEFDFEIIPGKDIIISIVTGISTSTSIKRSAKLPEYMSWGVAVKDGSDGDSVIASGYNESADLTACVSLIEVSNDDKIVLESPEDADFFIDTAVNPVLSYGKNMANYITLTSYPRQYDTSATVLYNTTSPLSIGAGTTRTFTFNYADPNNEAVKVASMGIVTPVATTDYWLNTSSAGTGADMTADLTVSGSYGVSSGSITFTNNNATAGYGSIQVRGTGIYLYDQIEYISQGTASQLEHGLQTLNVDMPYQDDPDNAEVIGNWLVLAVREPQYEVDKYPFYANRDDEHMTAFVHLEIGSRIHITETQSGFDRDVFIDAISFEIHPNKIVKCTYATRFVSSLTGWRLEIPGYSELGVTTVLG